MQIGERKLYRWMVIFESEEDCPYLEFLLGHELPDDYQSVFHWLDDDLERHTEIAEARAVAVVELPDWLTPQEARAWVQSRPERLEPFFDGEWHRHMDLLDQHFGGTAWMDAKSISVE